MGLFSSIGDTPKDETMSQQQKITATLQEISDLLDATIKKFKTLDQADLADIEKHIGFLWFAFSGGDGAEHYHDTRKPTMRLLDLKFIIESVISEYNKNKEQC